MNKGFSIIEVILAVGLFVIFASGSMRVVIQGLQMNRLGSEQSIATQYATEGLESVRSIRNQAYSNLTTTGATGVTQTGGVWTLSGTQNTFGKYNRVISIANVNRDVSGNIVSTGGTLDPYTKKITSAVNWAFVGGAQNKTVTLTSYLTDWKSQISKGGMVVFANGGATLQYRVINSIGNWSTVQTVPDIGVPLNRQTRVVNLYSSPTRDEKILITTHVVNGAGDDQYTYAQVWDGSSWGNVQLLSSWAGVTNPETRASDGDYLTNGNFLVVYEDNNNMPRYRIWNGSSWSAEGNTLAIDTLTTTTPVWIVVQARPGTNEAMVVVKDSLDDTNTMRWTGSGWANLTEHSTVSAGAAYETIDFVWNTTTPTTGTLIFNEAADNNPNFRTWNGTTWSAQVETANIGGVPRAIKIVSHPTASEFLSCFKDSTSDINCLESNFTPALTATTPTDLTASTDTGNQRSFSQAYEKSGTDGLIVYSDNSATPRYRIYNRTTNTFGSQLSLTALPGNLETVRILQNPDNDDLFVVMTDTGQRVYTVAWNGSTNAFYTTGGYALTQQGTLGSADEDMWADFAWDRF